MCSLLKLFPADVDECAEGSHTCAEGSTCINEDGGFRCQDPIQCEPGFRPSANQRSCIGSCVLFSTRKRDRALANTD